jgi:histidinol dehydrogenase
MSQLIKIIKLAKAELPNIEENIVQSNIEETVKKIITEVRERGDQALFDYAEQFDNCDLNQSNIRVSKEQIEKAYSRVDKSIIAALEQAKERIGDYHQKQMPADNFYKDYEGVKLGWKYYPLNTIGVYVPGGLANYPSSVLMNVIPAKVAGAKKIIMVTPAAKGIISDVVIAAAKIAEIDEIYLVGGAQAIAALAYGTQSIPKVDKIVGPGNAYVASAKQQVRGVVGVDMEAGPSEILIISDNQTEPKWIAADLLSQAEHDEMACSILITDDADFAQKVAEAVAEILPSLSKAEIARKAIENNGVIYVVEDLQADGVALANQIAPEHLELCVDNPDDYISQISTAGAIFIGRYTPEAIGDYMAGPSHVLPTSGSARFSSGLSVFDFLRRSSLIGCDADSFAKIADNTEILAEAEGLTAHALSIKVRK